MSPLVFRKRSQQWLIFWLYNVSLFCVWSWCDSPDVHGLMVSPRLQPPLLRPSHMVQHSQQTPALQDTTPTDQTSWHTDGHRNTRGKHNSTLSWWGHAQCYWESTCAKAETTKIRSQSFIKMLGKCNSLKHDRIVPLHARGIILRIKNTASSVPVNINDFSVFLIKTHIPTTLWVSRCRVGKFCWTFGGQMF